MEHAGHWVGDRIDHRVQPGGSISGFLSLPESVSNPSSLTTDLQGQLVFVGANEAWTSAKVVRVIDTTLTYPVDVNRPSQIAIDALGRFCGLLLGGRQHPGI